MGRKGHILAHHILGSQRQCVKGICMEYQKCIVKDDQSIVHLKLIEYRVPVIIQLKRRQQTGEEFLGIV